MLTILNVLDLHDWKFSQLWCYVSDKMAADDIRKPPLPNTSNCRPYMGSLRQKDLT